MTDTIPIRLKGWMPPASPYPITGCFPIVITTTIQNPKHPDCRHHFKNQWRASGSCGHVDQGLVFFRKRLSRLEMGQPWGIPWRSSGSSPAPTCSDLVLVSTDGGLPGRLLGLLSRPLVGYFPRNSCPPGRPFPSRPSPPTVSKMWSTAWTGSPCRTGHHMSKSFFHPGAKAPSDYVWNLSASASDVEDTGFLDLPLTGTWTSSKDGVLGQGQRCRGFY